MWFQQSWSGHGSADHSSLVLTAEPHSPQLESAGVDLCPSTPPLLVEQRGRQEEVQLMQIICSHLTVMNRIKSCRFTQSSFAFACMSYLWEKSLLLEGFFTTSLYSKSFSVILLSALFVRKNNSTSTDI